MLISKETFPSVTVPFLMSISPASVDTLPVRLLPSCFRLAVISNSCPSGDLRTHFHVPVASTFLSSVPPVAATPPTRATSASILRATVGSGTVRVISVSPSGLVLGALVGSPLAEACRPPSSGDCHVQFTFVALQTQFDLIAGFKAGQALDPSLAST